VQGTNCSPSVTPTGQHDNTNPIHVRSSMSTVFVRSTTFRTARAVSWFCPVAAPLRVHSDLCPQNWETQMAGFGGCEGRDLARASSFSIAICSSFKSRSIWRSETFPRLLLCNSDCSLAVSRASTNCGGAPAKECGLDPGENIQDWGRTASALPNGLFNLFNHPSFANPPSAVVAAPGPGLGAVGSVADHFRGGYTTSDPVFVEVFVLKTSGARQAEHCVIKLGFKIAMQRRLACAIYFPT